MCERGRGSCGGVPGSEDLRWRGGVGGEAMGSGGGRRAARLNESCGEWGRKAGSGGQRGEAAGALVQ